jgi:aminoglycoside phosphotransferase (APT) family kinase protein
MALEADAMRACRRAGLPVPEVLVDDDGSSLGTAGLVMARVPGETLARRILRDDEFATARQVLAEQLGRFLAGLHAIDPGEVPGLEPADSLAQYWTAYETLDDVSPAFEAAYRWLDAHRPPPAGQVVVHGDLRMGNVIVGEDGLRAAIDWELVHLGDPIEDLGWLCVKAWRFGAPLPVGGVGTVEQLIGAYEDESGTRVDRDSFHWWLVQKTLQWGIGCMGQAAVHLLGAVRSVELAAIGRRVAEQEWDLVELLAPEAWVTARAQPAAEPGDEPGLHGRPTAAELLDAARGFLTDTVMGATRGHVSFHTRVAANVLGIVERQLVLGPAQEARFRDGLRRLGASSASELCRAIRGGGLDHRQDDLWTFVASSVRDRLAVANPKHLARP